MNKGGVRWGGGGREGGGGERRYIQRKGGRVERMGSGKEYAIHLLLIRNR